MLFDSYIVVDWSANSLPKTGKDSIWWSHMAWEKGALVAQEANPATRDLAHQQIREILLGCVSAGKRVLIGFDFAYAYPNGFARAISASDTFSWMTVWQHINSIIEDDSNNRNNRFAAAGELNRILTGQASPFWGCPKSQCTDYLSMYKPRNKTECSFPELRITEQGTSAHSVWKLAYPGAVGSQVLTGLPYLHKLRNDPSLKKFSVVWPFETGLRELTAKDLANEFVIHAEIYPSLVTVTPHSKKVKDQLQVNALTQYFADLDYRGQMGKLFAGKRDLNREQKKIIENEEGWILGV